MHGLRRACVLLLALAGLAQAVDTVNPIPQPGANFTGRLQTFLGNEDAGRYREQFQPFVVSGCVGLTSAGLTHTPASCTAYPGGCRTLETASITYADESTCWVIIHKETAGNLSSNVTWTRVPGTHYLTSCSSSTLMPSIPTDTALLMRVVTTGGAITDVDDRRITWPTKRRPIDCINPLEPPYYADNSGNSDTSASLQLALDNAYAQGGGDVCLPHGTYKVSWDAGQISGTVALLMRAKTRLVCETGAVITADTSPPTGIGHAIIGIGDLSADHSQMSVEGCIIDGQYSAPTDLGETYFGIAIINGPGLTIDGVRLLRNEVRFIHGDALGGGQVWIGGLTKNVIIANNYLHHSNGQCITAGNGSAGDTYTNYTIQGNTCVSTSNNGAGASPEAMIFSPGTSFFSVTGNNVSDWGAIRVDGADSYVISGNTVNGVHAPNIGQQGAVVLSGTANVTNVVIGNNVLDVSNYDATNNPAGVFINTSGGSILTNVAISGNAIKRGQSIAAVNVTVNGIIVASPTVRGLTISGNTIYNGLDDATHKGNDINVAITGAANQSNNITINGNSLQSSSTAISLTSQAALRVQGVAITGNTTQNGGFMLQNLDLATIVGNTVRSGTTLYVTGENTGIMCLSCMNGSTIEGNSVLQSAVSAFGVRLRGVTTQALVKGNNLNLPGGGTPTHMAEATGEGAAANKWIDNVTPQVQRFSVSTTSAVTDHNNGSTWANANGFNNGALVLSGSSQVLCTDCAIGTPCAGGGTGAMAFRTFGGAWICQW